MWGRKDSQHESEHTPQSNAAIKYQAPMSAVTLAVREPADLPKQQISLDQIGQL
jgi:hypothetical protein